MVLPGPAAVPAPVRARERRVPAPGARRRRSRRRANARPSSSRGSVVANRADARPRDLSGGEAQRVALARALVVEPGCCSSTSRSRRSTSAPARASGSSSGTSWRGSRASGCSSRTTRSRRSTLADRLVLLEDGRVTQIGTPEEIRRAPRSRYAADLVGVNAVRGVLEPLGEGAGRLVIERGRRSSSPGPSGTWGARSSAIAPADRRDAVAAIAPKDRRGTSCHGRVTSVAIEGDRARVRLATAPPLVAEVTRARSNGCACAPASRSGRPSRPSRSSCSLRSGTEHVSWSAHARDRARARRRPRPARRCRAPHAEPAPPLDAADETDPEPSADLRDRDGHPDGPTRDEPEDEAGQGLGVAPVPRLDAVPDLRRARRRDPREDLRDPGVLHPVRVDGPHARGRRSGVREQVHVRRRGHRAAAT